MMFTNDGHSGIENRQVNQGGAGDFQLVLSFLKQGTGQGDFVIHATSNKIYLSGVNPLEYLSGIGFTHYRGECPFHRDKCLYRVIATLERDAYGFENHSQVHRIHESFQRFVERLDELFQLHQQQNKILQDIGIESSGKLIFGSPTKIEISEEDIPLWVNDVKFPRLQELEQQRARAQKEIDELNQYLPLLYGTGDVLEAAVVKALDFLGLDAKRTPKGFTADIYAETRDRTKKIGFEVTGISGQVKKDSNKLTQVLEFERIKEPGEKTVLVAGTYNKIPISQREGQENFTPQVLDFLGRHPILLMTGWDLYCMVRDVLDGSRQREDLVELLYKSDGELKYKT